jgi:hypothetical protein
LPSFDSDDVPFGSSSQSLSASQPSLPASDIHINTNVSGTNDDVVMALSTERGSLHMNIRTISMSPVSTNPSIPAASPYSTLPLLSNASINSATLVATISHSNNDATSSSERSGRGTEATVAICNDAEEIRPNLHLLRDKEINQTHARERERERARERKWEMQQMERIPRPSLWEMLQDWGRQTGNMPLIANILPFSAAT